MVPLFKQLNQRSQNKETLCNSFNTGDKNKLEGKIASMNCLSLFNSFKSLNNRISRESEDLEKATEFPILKSKKKMTSIGSLETSDASDANEKSISDCTSKIGECLDSDKISLKCCNCKKSRCLKLYCECFASGKTCVGDCSCVECLNTNLEGPERKLAISSILEKHPEAFTSKIVMIADSQIHKTGCNCKKSGCIKKYCECFNSGVPCTLSCKCEGCSNCEGEKPIKKIKLETLDSGNCHLKELNKLPLPQRIMKMLQSV